jgi:O-antigen ligase
MSEIWISIQQRLFGRQVVRWLRPVAIAVVLLGSYYLGRNGGVQLLALLVGGGMALIFMRYPFIAMISLVFASLFIPVEIGTGTGSGINLTMILIMVLMGLWLVDMLIQKRSIRIFSSRVMPPLFAFSIIAVLAFFAGQLPWFSFATQVSMAAQVGGLVLFLLSAGAFLWIANHVDDLKWLRWMVWIYVALGGLYTFMHFTVIAHIIPGVSRVPLYIKDATGSIFWVWIVALSASQALLNRKLKMRWRILLGMVSFITLAAGWQNRQWASGYLPAVIALLVVLLMVEWRIGVFAGVLMVLAVLVFNPPFVDPAFTSDQYSAITRAEAWKIVLGDIWRINPLLGLGPSNYYNYTRLFPILGYNVQFNSHNQYVDILAQTGILGMAAFLWLVFEIGWLGWRLKDRAAPGFNYAYVIGALAGLVGTLVAGMFGDWLIPFVYNVTMSGFRTSVFAWVFLGGLVAIERLTKAPSEEMTLSGEIQARNY